MAQVLDELYVDITARGLAEAKRQVEGYTRQVAEAKKVMDRMRGDPFAEATRGARQAAEAAGQMRQQADRPIASGRTLPGGFNPARTPQQAQSQRTASLAAPPPPQTAAATEGAAGIGKALGGIAIAATAATAAVGVLVSLTSKGLQGTVELDMFGKAVVGIGRELANLVGPALRLVTSLIRTATESFRGMGASGQNLLSIFSPVAAMFQVFGDPAVQTAVKQLAASFADLVKAGQPFITILANIATAVLNTFVIRPLVSFLGFLTKIVNTVEEFTRKTAALARELLTVLGLSRLLEQPQRARQVSLNQTGQFGNAMAAYQDYTSAALGAGKEDPVTKNTNKIEELSGVLNNLIAVIKQLMDVVKAGSQIGGAIGDRIKDDAVNLMGGINAAGKVLGNMFNPFGR